MVGINQLQTQDTLSNYDSMLHKVDSRIKLITLVLTIIFVVSVDNFMIFLAMEVYLLILIYLSQIPIKDALIRVCVILPFGFFIAIFQPFIQPGEILYSLPLGINITLEGMQFAQILLSRLTVSITSIVLFSYITPMKDIAEAFRRLHFPNEFAMIFSLFVRFIFLFYDELSNITQAQKSRGFSYTNKTPYGWKLKQIGSIFLMMFIRAYERGETVYNSMASRGYSQDSKIYTSGDKLSATSMLYLTIPIIIMVILLLLQHNHII